MTRFELAPGTAETALVDTLVIVLDCQGEPDQKTGTRCRPVAEPALWGPTALGEVTRIMAAECASGPIDSPSQIPAPRSFEAKHLLLAPISGTESAEELRRAVGAAMLQARGPGSIAVCGPGSDPTRLRALCEGAALGSYRFNRLRKDSAKAQKSPPTSVDVLLAEPSTKDQRTIARRAFSLANAVCEARDLVNLPPNLLYPATLAKRSTEYLADVGVSVEIFKPKDLKEGYFGGLLAVGQGSRRGPRLIKLEYHPEGAKQHVALVGKGITFDSGGLSIKPAKSMEWMKSDMGGAAAVLAAVRSAADQCLPIQVTGWLAAAENMPGGNAQRPGDVITIRGGKTVEVLNTDAEGRLVLADAIVRAGEDSPDVIIDVATLTGAQMVALGPTVCGVMGNNEALTKDLIQAAEESGESAWPMPLPPELRPSLDSNIADLANIGDRNGGMLTAGLFLQEFVESEIPWAHLDIAGPSWNPSKPHGYTPKGGTGFSVRTLVQYLADMAGR